MPIFLGLSDRPKTKIRSSETPPPPGTMELEFFIQTYLIRVTELLIYVNDLAIWYNLSPLENLLFIFIFIVIVQDDCSAKTSNAIFFFFFFFADQSFLC